MGIFGGNSVPKFNGTPIGDPVFRTQEEVNARVKDGIGNHCDYVNRWGKVCKDPRMSGNARCGSHVSKP